MNITTISDTLITAKQLYALPSDRRCELVKGEIRFMSPAGINHGIVASNIGGMMREFVLEKQLGIVVAAETGFILETDPDTVRAPDVAFIRAERLRKTTESSFFDGPPDLAVEVLSPSDSASSLSDKVWQWLNSGTVSVWVIDPEKRTMESRRKSHDKNDQFVTRSGDTLTDDLLSGFELKASEVFAGMIESSQ